MVNYYSTILNMKKQITTIIILILSINAFAQNNINGIILDANTLEPMVGVSSFSIDGVKVR